MNGWTFFYPYSTHLALIAPDGNAVRDEDGSYREFTHDEAYAYIAAASAPAIVTQEEALFDGDEYDKCPNCGAGGPENVWAAVVIRDDNGTIVGCIDCYVNYDCPDQCQQPHPAPEEPARRWSGVHEWTCPQTGRVYRWCCGQQEWLDPDQCPNGREVDGDWYSDPWEYGYVQCTDCGVWTDDSYSCDYCDEYDICYRCMSRSHDHEDGADDDWHDPDNERGWNEPARCDLCQEQKPLTHMHPDDESALCSDCASPTDYAVAA